MPTPIEKFEEMKQFLEFGPQDVANLRSIRPIFERHGPALTDAFYATLALYPETAAKIEGRVDALKKTHIRWMMELFDGVDGGFGAPYFENRQRVGMAHVRVGIDPRWVEGVMSVLRTGAIRILSEVESGPEVAAKYASLAKVLDLDLMIINLSYADERLERLTKFTGMSRRLIEACITKAT